MTHNRLENIMGMLLKQPHPFVIDTQMQDRFTTERNLHGIGVTEKTVIKGENIVALFDWRFDLVWMNGRYNNNQLASAYDILMMQVELMKYWNMVPDDEMLVVTKDQIPQKPNNLPKIRPVV